ncbi:hypothetical protein IQ267_16315 [filamentous cyanobacterium LEGE 07170]|nr:hypothetical protein [filamentous cyanobacterium LEGE 07170]
MVTLCWAIAYTLPTPFRWIAFIWLMPDGRSYQGYHGVFAYMVCSTHPQTLWWIRGS